MIRLFYFLFSVSAFHFPHCSGKTNKLQLTNICNTFLMLWQHVRWDVSIVRGSPGLSACPIGFTLHPCGNVPRRTRPTGTRVLVCSSRFKHRPIVPDMICSWIIFSCCRFPQTPEVLKRRDLCFVIMLLPSLYHIRRCAVVNLASKTNPEANFPPWIVTLPVALGFIPVFISLLE